nr:hypothetical protein CFP56_24620 [Quercus suber]
MHVLAKKIAARRCSKRFFETLMPNARRKCFLGISSLYAAHRANSAPCASGPRADMMAPVTLVCLDPGREVLSSQLLEVPVGRASLASTA